MSLEPEQNFEFDRNILVLPHQSTRTFLDLEASLARDIERRGEERLHVNWSCQCVNKTRAHTPAHLSKSAVNLLSFSVVVKLFFWTIMQFGGFLASCSFYLNLYQICVTDLVRLKCVLNVCLQQSLNSYFTRDRLIFDSRSHDISLGTSCRKIVFLWEIYSCDTLILL